MSGVGAPIGNQNAAKAKRWQEAILRALARKANSIEGGLDQAADKLVALAVDSGDKWALDHMADRIDGKATQSIDTKLDASSRLLEVLSGLGTRKDP
jgi:hypothetical protein